ncbi:hypothetical protein T484DRAFT_1833170 [Baffinella frigidus]|nr:hypothetical protein T484DRAFT_1833170 [Cryptophyta sp. CCMP2293]
MQTFYTIMTSVGARMGTSVIAAHAIARQCSSLEALVVDGLAVAAQCATARQRSSLKALVVDGASSHVFHTRVA